MYKTTIIEPGCFRKVSSERHQTQAELKRSQDRLLYLCDSTKLVVSKDQTKEPLVKLVTMIATAFSRVVELMLSLQVTGGCSLISRSNPLNPR